MNNKIDHQLFSAREHALDKEPCPDCPGELHIRHGKHGAFLGCTNYPACHYIRPLHQSGGQVIKSLAVPCPICEHELVLRQGRYGMFIGCSHYPECNYIQNDQAEDAQPKLSCPECLNGFLTERKTRHGKTFYSCDHYPKCKFAINLLPVAGKCNVCGFHLLVEKKLVDGIKYLCADKKCGQQQNE